MTPAESAERARLCDAIDAAEQELDDLYDEFCGDAVAALAAANRALASFDAAHKGEG